MRYHEGVKPGVRVKKEGGWEVPYLGEIPSILVAISTKKGNVHLLVRFHLMSDGTISACEMPPKYKTRRAQSPQDQKSPVTTHVGLNFI